MRQEDSVWTQPQVAAVSPNGDVVFITTMVRPVPLLPIFPPGFDDILDQIADPKQVANFSDPELGDISNIYWISSAALPGPDK
jgi:hypothetical protein